MQDMQDMQDIQDMQDMQSMQNIKDMQDMYSMQNIKGMQAMQEMQDKQDIQKQQDLENRLDRLNMQDNQYIQIIQDMQDRKDSQDIQELQGMQKIQVIKDFGKPGRVGEAEQTGKKSSKVGISMFLQKSLFYSQTFTPAPINFKFNIRGEDEIRLILPVKWITSFSIIYLISGIIIGSCEIYLMSHGIKSWYSLLGPIRGYRIGFSVIFIANGILCCILLKLNAKKKWIILITLFLTIVSLVMSRYGFK